MSLEWKAIDGGRSIHIVPVTDIRLHEIVQACWCWPRVDPDTPNMVVHHSLLPDDENPEKTAH